MAHPADQMVKSAFATREAADEYVLPADAPLGALVKADAVKLGLDAQKDGKIRLTCGSWEDARVLLPGQMLAIRRESTFWVISKIETASLQHQPGDPMVELPENPTPADASHALANLAAGLHRRFGIAGVFIKDEIKTFVGEVHELYQHLEGQDAPAPAPAPAAAPQPDPQIATLQSQVDALTGTVAQLTAANSSLQLQVTDAHTQIDAMNAAAVAAAATISGLNARLAALPAPAPITFAPTAAEVAAAATQGTPVASALATPAAVLTGDPASINPIPAAARLPEGTQMAPNPPAEAQPQDQAALPATAQ